MIVARHEVSSNTYFLTPIKKIISLFLLSIAISSNAFAISSSNSEGFTKGKPNYFDIEQPFVVNITDGARLRFLQISINLMTLEPKVVDAVHTHLAPIKHELIMLFAEQRYHEVVAKGAKEKLRQKALASVQHVLEEYAYIDPAREHSTGEGHIYNSSVQDLFFTSFIIQ